MPGDDEQDVLEMELRHISSAATSKISRIRGLQNGLRKDLKTALERDFQRMRCVTRKLEVLAEDQECVQNSHLCSLLVTI